MDTQLDGDGSSSDLDISTDINGCIKSLDDDIEGPSKSNAAAGSTQSSRSSSSSSSSSSSDSSSSSSSKSSKSSSHKNKKSSSSTASKEKVPEQQKFSLPPLAKIVAATTDRVLYPARFHKKHQMSLEKSSSHKAQHRSRSRSRGPPPRSSKESGYKTDGSITSENMRRKKSRAPSAPRSSLAAPVDIDLDLMGLQLSTEPSTSVKLTKKNVTMMARKNDTNNNNNNNSNGSSSKVRPLALNLELNRRLLEHKMNLNGRSMPFSSSSCKLGFGFKNSQSFQELTATSKVMAPSWMTDNEKNSSKPVKYAKSLPRTMKSRRPSVASRAGSVRSCTSSMSRLRRAPTPAAIKNNEYVTAQVGEITAALAKCSISSSKPSKISKSNKITQNNHQQSKSKKKTEEVTKKPYTGAKRGRKKIIRTEEVLPVAEEHKLPLKKRHYLIAEEKASKVKQKKSKKAPPGVFEPSNVDNEDTASFDDVYDHMMNQNMPDQNTPTPPAKQQASKLSVVDNILTKMEPTVNKRKRRRANRTGFPTPKRPKKKPIVQQPIISDNVSESSSNIVLIKRRKKKSKNKVVPDDDVQVLTARQLLLKQQKEIEINAKKKKEEIVEVNHEPRSIRGRAKSICHIPEVPQVQSINEPIKRKRRQTIFIDKKESEEPTKEEEIIPLPALPIEPIKKKRRQTVHLEHPTSSVPKKPRRDSSLQKVDDNRVKIIPRNVYNGDTQKKALQPSLKGSRCRCAPNPCGESCLNRSVFIECDVTICGKTCTNTVIQTGGLLTKDVEKFQTEQKGWGVRTKKDIPKKTLILEYTGEVLFKEAFRSRMQTIYKNDQHHYCLELSNGLVLDAHRMGSLCRFVNHSCKPNCGMAKIYVDGLPRMILQAEDDIKAGSELTYDYKFDNFEDMTPQQCYCGADTCRGTLSATIKTPRRMSMSHKEGEAFIKRTGRKIKSVSRNPKANSCFLVRNLKRIEKHNPALMEYYRNINNQVEDDPKIGFAFVSKTHENSPPAPSTPKEDEQQTTEEKKENSKEQEEELVIVHQPLSEQSQVLWQICERLENCFSSKLKEIFIPPPPASGHSNHDRISLPVSFEDIKTNVKMGLYDLNPLLFHYNMKIMLDNVVKFWGVNCHEFHTMIEVRDGYKTIRTELIEEIRRVWEDELLVNAMMDKIVKKPAKNRRKIPERQDDEDIVNCHCGRYLEEGVMIQCQKCLTWQHVDCAGTDGKAENYCCVKCEPRTVEMEIIKNDETTADGHQCYLTIMRGDLQIRVGDAVYVLRDIPIDPEKVGGPRHTFETIGKVNYSECDIVRVETIYKDSNGEPRVLGHHYLRPNEVYHEPSRKFYTNELMRTSIFESIPINLVIDTCWVLDPNNYFKGRPINSIEQHVYICEYKVDKLARVFSVIKKSSRQPISTKPYAFYKFEELLRQRRNHLPHDIDHVIPKKLKKEMQTKQKERDQEIEKDAHRSTSRKSLSVKEKMKNLTSCIDRIQKLKDSKNKKNSNDLKTNSNSKHNHEIKSKFEANSDKNLKEKKKPGKRGRKKKADS